MKKKTACLIVIILLIVFLVLCFMPIVFNESYWKITDSWGSRSHMFDKPKDILSTCQEDFESADELEKYKKLLDRGIITQAEYNAKKKQLLDL